MLEVQKYLRKYGLEKLKSEFSIVATEYEDRVTLNYNQIESCRFHPICDECRGLILRKNTWEVMAISFQRFYNLSEGIDITLSKNTNIVDPIRIAAYDRPLYKPFPIADAIIETKLDGSLLSCYYDGYKWCVSTRKLAFAEGSTNLGRTFEQVFMEAASKTELFTHLNENVELKDFTFVFELTGRENRVVTPYDENTITLIGARSNKEEFNYRELTTTELNNLASIFKVNRPKSYSAASYEELLHLVNSFPSMDEGVVLKIEVENGSHMRIKVKNPAYLAIAHIRGNGVLSPKNVLSLVIDNEHLQYLCYFPEDKKYFDFVEAIYTDVKKRIAELYEEVKGIESQKDFALTMIPKTVYSFEKGILFSMRKGLKLDDLLKEMGGKKLALGLNLKQKFIDEFHIAVEEVEEDDKK